MKIILGESDFIPGKLHAEYECKFDEERLYFKNIKIFEEYSIEFKELTKAEFIKEKEFLYLNCIFGKKNLVFGAKKEEWKSKEGKELVSKIKETVQLENYKDYSHFISPLFFIFR